MENNKGNNVIEILSLIVAIASIVPLFLAPTKELSPTVWIVFGILIAIVIVTFIFVYTYSKYREVKTEIRENGELVAEMKRDINYLTKMNKMEIRMGILESRMEGRNKKGVIDPRIILAILMIVLLILFFKVLKGS